MSSTVPHLPETPSVEDPSPTPQPLTLTERLPERLRATRSLALFTGVLGAIFWRLSFRPLWHTDVWGHLSYGKLLWQSGAIPATEPFMPLAAGMPLVDSAWLSQWIGYGAYSILGIVGLQFLFAASVTLCLALLLWGIHRKTGSAPWCLLGTLSFLWLEWQQLLVGWPEAAALLRPQLAGLVCFVGLFVLLVSRRERSRDWFAVPALFIAWANLHGSFVIGILLLGCFTVGTAIDVWRRSGRLSCTVRCGRVRRLFLLTQLAGVAALSNPYGIKLYLEVLTFSNNPNLRDLVEWEALSIRSSQGQAVACIALALAIVYRLSPRRVSATELLMLLGFGIWTLWTSRMLVWWGAPAVYCLAVHGHAAWNRRHRRTAQVPARRSGLWSAVTVGLVWIFFAGSSFGVRLLHGSQANAKKLVSGATPVAAVEYLRKHPPQGQIFNTYEWGDYLGWAGPPGLKIYLNSHAHLVPREIWQHYLAISHAAAGWDDLLDRDGVTTIIVDAVQSEQLVSQLRDDEKWQVAYEDGNAVIFVRRQPMLGGTTD